MTAAVLGAPSRRGKVLVAVASFLAPTANVKFLRGLSPRERMKWSWKPKGWEEKCWGHHLGSLVRQLQTTRKVSWAFGVSAAFGASADLCSR